LTTKGDLFGYDTDVERIPIGANDEVLTADSTQALGLKWAAAAGGTDADAIHDNVDGEIVLVTEKVSPVGADLILIEDSAASNAKKRVQITNLPGGADADAIHDNVASEISAIASKATPIDADFLLIEDSAAGDAKKKITIGDLPITVWSPILDNKGSTDTPDDDFDSGSLDGKWTAVNGSSGTVSFLETAHVNKYDLGTRSGWLLIQAGNSGSRTVELRQDWTLGDGESIILAISPGLQLDDTAANNDHWIGMAINDDDAGYDAGSNKVWVNAEVQAAGQISIFAYDGSTIYGKIDNAPGLWLLYFRIARVGTSYYASVSRDGSSWTLLGDKTIASAPNNLWIFVDNINPVVDPVPITAVYWIRQGTNTLDPW
jgi:hypothetical protein